MKTGKSLRALSVLLAGCMTLSVLAGCHQQGDDSQNSGTGSTADRTLEGNVYREGFPIADKKITLRVLTTIQPNQIDYDSMPMTSYYEDLSNIHIEWETVTYGPEATQKVQLDFLSGNAPDIVSLPNKLFTDAMIEDFSSQGKLREVGSMIEKWAPNIKALMDKLPDSYALSTASDGKIYSLPRLTEKVNHMAYGQKCYIRTSWLEALGLEMPTTTQEFYNVLKAFKTQDPNGNGKTDEIPFVFPLLTPEVFSWWGVNYNENSYGMMINQATGVPEYAMSSDNVRQAVQYFKRLYDENLLSQKAVNEPNRFTSMVQSGNVGCFYYLANFVICDEDLAKEYTLLPPLDTGTGYASNCYYSGYDQITPNAIVVSSTSQNAEAALRWCDYFYTVYGHYLLANGAPGDQYEITEDGKIRTLRPWSPEDSNKVIGGQLADGVALNFDDYLIKEEKPESEMTAIEVFNKHLDPDCNETFAPYLPQYPLRYPRASAELARTLEEEMTSIKSYSNGMLISFIVGVENIDTGWSSYIAELKRLGLDSIVEQYQKEYAATYG